MSAKISYIYITEFLYNRVLPKFQLGVHEDMKNEK